MCISAALSSNLFLNISPIPAFVIQEGVLGLEQNVQHVTEKNVTDKTSDLICIDITYAVESPTTADDTYCTFT